MPETRSSKIAFDDKGIGQALLEGQLAIPPHQREYAWGAEEVTELFEDLNQAEQSDDQEYFLGTVVVTETEATMPQVADGQQRLATITMLFVAIRDYLLTNGQDRKAEKIERDFIQTNDLRTDEEVPRLRLNTVDHEFFQRTILARDHVSHGIEPSKPSHTLMLQASELAVAFVGGIVAHHKPEVAVNRLVDWAEFIKTKVRIIVVRVPDTMNAYTLFETLNDRGLELAQTDLVKNYLFGRASDRLPEVQSRWLSTIGTLEAADLDRIQGTYLRHYVISRFGPTSHKKVFVRIKENVKSKTHAMVFADALAEDAGRYVALIHSDHELWTDYGESTRANVRTLGLLRVEQIRPLLLAVLRHFSVGEVRKSFRLFVSWCVRFLIVGGGGAGALEKYYGQLAKDVTEQEISTAKGLAKALAGFVPSDVVFSAAFATARVSNSYQARYYLRALEQKNRGLDSEVVPSEDTEVVNLEHVMPSNPSADWKLDPETLSAYSKRIGNLALFKARGNAAIGNLSFAKKSPELRKSAFTLTAEIGTESKWGTQEIEDRQRRLATLAVETWPIEP